ncbi:MAG: nitroreductase family protein [Candidatus Hermodarchaeota archaeon]
MINPEIFLQFLKDRRTIRSFQEKMISDKEIKMILEAGRWAPSASNRQPWEFIVIKNKEKKQELAKLAGYGKFIGDAPIIIAIIGKIKQNPRWYIQDTSLVSMNMMLMAWALGIGTCWIGTMDREKAKKSLKLGENDFVLTVLPMGYIKGEIPEPTYRKGLEKIAKEI